MAGNKKCKIIIVGKYDIPFTENEAICPTSPLVPIPEAILFEDNLKTVVESIPNIALETIGGIHIIGFLIIFKIFFKKILFSFSIYILLILFTPL